MSTRYLIFGLLSLLLVGCGSNDSTQWHAHDISGVMPRLQFHLTDDTGQAVTGKDYRGKITMVYFGYTSCQYLCPKTLTELGTAIHGLGSKADKVQVLFVSVDPKRDSDKVLRRYVKNFSPEIVGLTGSQKQLHTVTKRYRVGYSYGKPDAKGNYVVNHSSAVFVFDGQGRARLLMDQGEKAGQITADLSHLIAGLGSPDTKS